MTEHSGHREPNDVADALSAYWDSRADNDAAADAGAADGLVTVVDRLHASDTTPALLPEQRQAIWQEIMATQAMGPGPQSQATHRPLGFHGSAPELPRPHPTGIPRWSRLRARPGWVVGQLAAAALLLLTLVGSFLAFGLGRPERQDKAAVFIPAISGTPGTALPSGVNADVILLRATLERMPSLGGTHQLALYRNRLAPGAEEPVGSQADTGVGNELCTIESGQVTVEADAPVLLTRAVANPVAAPSLVEPGTALVLDVGDQLLAPSGVTFRRRNEGLTTATILCFSIGTYGDSARIWAKPPGVTYVHGLPFKLLSTFPPVPAEATVHRLTLAPGAELAIRDLPGLELVYVEAGTLDLVYAKAETPATPERAFTIQAGSGTDTFGRSPERAVLANRGTEPLVLLTALVVPTSAGEARLQPP